MPGIRKRKEIRVIEDPDYLDEERRILLCPHCLEFSFKEPLRHKILMRGGKPARDYEDWAQCVTGCGKIFPRCQVKVEGILTDTIELVDNPHDIGPSIVGLGNKIKKNSREKDRNYWTESKMKKILKLKQH